MEISILRDTGASQSLLLRSKLPKRVIEATRETVMIEGIGGKRVKIPLCKITLEVPVEKLDQLKLVCGRQATYERNLPHTGE